MRGLVQGIAAVVLAVVAEGVLYQRVAGRPVDATVPIVLFILASILIYRAVGTTVPDALAAPEADASREWLRPRSSDDTMTGWSIGIVAVIANLTALILFARNAQLNLAWLLYVASAVGGVVAAYYLDPPDQRSLAFRRPRVELVALIAVLLLAAFFRFYRIDSYPVGLWFDEAQQGLASQRILADAGFRPVWLTGISPDPALRLYFQALLFVILGPTKLALRLIPAAGGMLGVLAAYLLGRELFGWRTGLVAGALLSVLTWHVDFSRIDLSGVWSVAFDALAAYFLVKALRTGRYLDFALAGACLGLGVDSYWTSYLFCIVVALFLLHRLAFRRIGFLRASLAGLVVLAVALALTVSPLAEFATSHRDEYASRLGQVSLLQEIDQAHSLAPLEHNVVAHLLMFNYQGDGNGRHNLSGWPELDHVTAGLFILGLIVCARFWRRPNYALPVLSVLIILLGGILSVDFEAPQSIRTIDNSLNSAILAAIPIAFLWEQLAEMRLGRVSISVRRLGITGLSTGAVLTIGLLAWVSSINFERYFVIQASDNASYAVYSTAPTLLAETMSRLGPAYDVYMSQSLVGQPSINFLSPLVKQEISFDPSASLPLRDHQNVALFFDADDSQYFDVVRRLYPAATFAESRVTARAPIILYSAIVPLAQIDALKGLDGSYVPGRTADAPAKLRRDDKTIDIDWSRQAPLPTPFVATWSGVLLAPVYGTYQLRLGAASAAILKIDQREVLKGDAQTSLSLAQGLHAIELTVPVDGPGSVQLWWKQPGRDEEIVPGDDLFRAPADNRGLLGQFYRNVTWSGPPALERIDVGVNQNFHFLPLPQPFSVQWTGKIDIPRAGLYRFETQSIDYSWLYLDNRLVVDNSRSENQNVVGAVNLSEGLHDIRLSYLDRSQFSHIAVFWQPPGAPRTLLPADRLFPPQGAYPERAGPLLPETPIAVSASEAAPPPTPQASSPGPAVGTLPAAPLTVKAVIGSPGSGDGQLSDPRGVTVDAQGNVYAVDTGNQRVEEFTSDGAWVRTIGAKGDGEGQFQEPVSAVINPKGQLAVLDSTTGWISRFSPTGAFLGRFGGPSAGFYHPRGIAVDAAGNYYVADTGTSQVVVFNPAGALVKKLGGPTRSQGQSAMQPTGVAVDSQGFIYVVDAANFLLIRYDPTFAEQQSWSLPRFDSLRAAHVTVGPTGDVYVTDPGNHRVIHVDAQGKPTDQLGTGDQLTRPVGIASDANGRIYVADSDGARVVVYGP